MYLNVAPPCSRRQARVQEAERECHALSDPPAARTLGHIKTAEVVDGRAQHCLPVCDHALGIGGLPGALLVKSSQHTSPQPPFIRAGSARSITRVCANFETGNWKLLVF